MPATGRCSPGSASARLRADGVIGGAYEEGGDVDGDVVGCRAAGVGVLDCVLSAFLRRFLRVLALVVRGPRRGWGYHGNRHTAVPDRVRRRDGWASLPAHLPGKHVGAEQHVGERVRNANTHRRSGLTRRTTHVRRCMHTGSSVRIHVCVYPPLSAPQQASSDPAWAWM